MESCQKVGMRWGRESEIEGVGGGIGAWVGRSVAGMVGIEVGVRRSCGAEGEGQMLGGGGGRLDEG